MSKTNLDELDTFLSSSINGKKWISHKNWFNKIEAIYSKYQKEVKLTIIDECQECQLFNNCCAVRCRDKILIIEHQFNKYRLCKPQEREQALNDSYSSPFEYMINSYQSPDYQLENHKTCENCFYYINCRNKKNLLCGCVDNRGRINPNQALLCPDFKPNV